MSLETRGISFAQAVGSDVKALYARMKVVAMTQAAYDALATKDANTLYVIIG